MVWEGSHFKDPYSSVWDPPPHKKQRGAPDSLELLSQPRLHCGHSGILSSQHEAEGQVARPKMGHVHSMPSTLALTVNNLGKTNNF